MADKLEDGEFWLPSEFLTDDDILLDKENINKNGHFRPPLRFPADFPYSFGGSFGSSSVLSSPVESALGSSEAESEEDDPLAGCLAQHFARSASVKENARVLSNSPQSTLSVVGSWSRNGSPNGPSQGSSPTTTPSGACNDPWDLIYQAAGQVAKLKINSEVSPRLSRGFTAQAKNLNFAFYSNQCLLPHFLPRTNQFQQMGQNQIQRQQSFPGGWDMKHPRGGWVSNPMVQRAGVCVGAGVGVGVDGRGGVRCGRALEVPQSPWHALQAQRQCPQNESRHGGFGMKADLLRGGSAVGGKVKRECAGTGVFLPRRYNGSSDSRKKPGCPTTALLPNKVGQTLNKNFEDFGVYNYPTHTRCGGPVTPDYDLLMARRNFLMAQQRRTMRQEGVMNHDLLPSEWTY